LNKAKKALEIEDKELVAHAMRHTCASRLIEKGVDLYTVSKVLGHSNIAVTERYSHLQLAAVESAIAKLED
jgi:site-specific recombinase XerD